MDTLVRETEKPLEEGRITAEEVIEAYKEMGIVPTAGTMCFRDGDNIYSCGAGAWSIYRHFSEQFLEGGGFVAGGLYEAMRKEFGYYYINAFFSGFDRQGIHKHLRNPPESEYARRRIQEGYDDGMNVRRAVERELKFAFEASEMPAGT